MIYLTNIWCSRDSIFSIVLLRCWLIYTTIRKKSYIIVFYICDYNIQDKTLPMSFELIVPEFVIILKRKKCTFLDIHWSMDYNFYDLWKEYLTLIPFLYVTCNITFRIGFGFRSLSFYFFLLYLDVHKYLFL